ncbi:MAG TPA: hypothetical protein IAC34_05650 [Candidatus Coprenecus stercoripullorum]|nr:hypothetical protein [Candidatus Coprenecus stercoripullorum]
MKKVKVILLSFVSLIFASTVSAQGKYGATPEDSLKCLQYLSFFQTYQTQKDLANPAAAAAWRNAIRSCPPTASQNMIVDGIKIIKMDLSKYGNNPVRKQELLDTLMMLHNMRIDTYGSDPTGPYRQYFIPSRMNYASDVINYAEQGDEQRVFGILDETIETGGARTSVPIIVRYMDFANKLYAAGSFTADDVLNAFEKAISTLDEIEKAKPSEMVAKAISDVESLFASSGAADCDRLLSLFGPRYENNPNDEELLSNIVTLFSSLNCTDADLFRNAVEGLHKMDPDHNSAYLLFKLYSSLPDQSDMAVKYMEEAIAEENSDTEQDAEYYYELALYYSQTLANNVKAVESAKECAKLSETLAPKAYFLIGTIWGSMKCEGNEIDTRAPYWIAVDYMQRAKNMDPALAEDAQKYINSFSQYFPAQDMAFMYSLVDGETYSVSCNGLSETTTVRTQK